MTDSQDNEFEALLSEKRENKLTAQIDKLQQQLSEEQQGRRNDKFLTALAALILIDIHVFSGMSG